MMYCLPDTVRKAAVKKVTSTKNAVKEPNSSQLMGIFIQHLGPILLAQMLNLSSRVLH